MELTNEQVEQAVEAARNTRTPVLSWSGSGSENGLELWRNTMRAAAPFLQLPWDEPTEDELLMLCGTGGGYHSRTAIIEFVRRRNAALATKPVDPRIEKVKAVLAKRYTAEDALLPAVAADILAALDGKQGTEFKFGFTVFNPLESAANDHMYQTVVLDRPGPPREGFKKNTADMPKVVDSRKEKIVSGIERYGYIGDKYALADMILAAMDEVK